MWPGVEDHHNVAENEKCYVNLSRVEQRVDRPRERCPQFKSEISFPSHSAPHSPSFHNIAISSLQCRLSSSLHSFYTQHQDFSIILSHRNLPLRLLVVLGPHPDVGEGLVEPGHLDQQLLGALVHPLQGGDLV